MNKRFFKTIILIATLSIIFTACNKKDVPIPDEQELITTMKLSVTDGGSFSKTFIYKIENGFGSTTQGTVQIDTIALAANTTYSVTAELFNEKADPIENTTDEILQEQDEHLFLYQSTPASGAGSIAFSKGSKDHNGLPFNQTITFTTGNAGAGRLQIDLMHQPTNKNGITPDVSGGETDAEAVYPVVVN